MLDEKRTVAALREAFKGAGYHVAFTEDQILVRNDVWAFWVDSLYIPPKVLGTIVEHIGLIPNRPAAYRAQKDLEPGYTCMLDDELNAWKQIREIIDKSQTKIRRTGLLLDGFEIWQTSQGLKARPMDPRYTSMVEGDASLNAFIQMDADKLGPAIAFHTFVGEVIIQGVDYSKNGNMARIEGFPWLGEGSA